MSNELQRAADHLATRLSEIDAEIIAATTPLQQERATVQAALDALTAVGVAAGAQASAPLPPRADGKPHRGATLDPRLVLQLLATGQKRPREVSGALDVVLQTARGAFDVLVKHGHAQATGATLNRKWQITDKGRKSLKEAP